MYTHALHTNGHEPSMGWTTGNTNINVRQIIKPSLVRAEGIGFISSMRRAKYIL